MKLRVTGALSMIVIMGVLAAVAVVASGAGGSPDATISGLETDMWSPMEVTIPAGGNVTFQNASTNVPHGVVWKSGPETPHCEGVPIGEGRTNWKGTCSFTKEGLYEFYCYVHGMKMSGKIFVGTATTSTSSSSSSSSTSAYGTTSTTMSMSAGSSMEGSMQGMSGSGGSRSAGSGSSAFLAPLMSVSTLASTVPANGDLNPYGVALVSHGAGKLHAGDLLISNFNDKANEQGTGTTIEQISPAGTRSQFAALSGKALPGRCPGGVGLTTAIAVLPSGYVIVGSLPTKNGKSATAKYGCLIVLDSAGKAVETIAGPKIQGPWDMAAISEGSTCTLFLSNVLNGGAAAGRKTIDNSTVLRVRLRTSAKRAPKVIAAKVIANGIPWRDSKEALVVGPTGLALASDGTLYLADTLANSITAIPDALSRGTVAPDGGRTVSKGGSLKEPLGLALAPNGDILTTNAGDGNIVETTPGGKQLLARTVDSKTGAGSLFGLLAAPGGKGVYFVDDGENTLNLLH
jgi:plastocyanin